MHTLSFITISPAEPEQRSGFLDVIEARGDVELVWQQQSAPTIRQG